MPCVSVMVQRPLFRLGRTQIDAEGMTPAYRVMLTSPDLLRRCMLNDAVLSLSSAGRDTLRTRYFGDKQISEWPSRVERRQIRVLFFIR